MENIICSHILYGREGEIDIHRDRRGGARRSISTHSSVRVLNDRSSWFCDETNNYLTRETFARETFARETFSRTKIREIISCYGG